MTSKPVSRSRWPVGFLRSNRALRLRRRHRVPEEHPLAPPRPPAEPPLPAPEVTLRGPVHTESREELAETLTAVARAAPRPVLGMRGTLTRDEDPALARPVEARATLDLGRHVVHAHVAAATEHEAIDLLVPRLRRQLRDLADRAVAGRRSRR